MSDHICDLIRLAQVNSAAVHFFLFMDVPQWTLDVVAQRSGFNWELRIQPDPIPFEPVVDYFPYLILELKVAPDWPKDGGIGPVVLPTALHKPITRVGRKGIEVRGANGFSKKFDL